MKKQYIWIGFGILLLIYAFDALVLGLSRPLFSPPLDAFANSVARGAIAMFFSALIFIYVSFEKWSN